MFSFSNSPLTFIFASVEVWHLLRLLLGGLLGLGASGLPGGSLLLGLLRAADGAHAGNGILADIAAVSVLSALVGNTLVDPMQRSEAPSAPMS